ncbi:MAG: transcriptional repressor [Verrucomicrobia bacterium]|nr:transcriptional repressor [Verrucomicrobiota bacterium]
MKRKVPIDFAEERLNERLARTGLRFTAQRRHVYGVLLEKKDHPSAEEVFMRAKDDMPDISMATVYNCLDTLVKCGLVKQVNHDRGATRYCSNMREHHHFYCDECHGTFDIDYDPSAEEPEIHMPDGFHVRAYEIAFRGICPDCAARKRGK